MRNVFARGGRRRAPGLPTPNFRLANGTPICVVGDPFSLDYPVPPGARHRCPPIALVAAIHPDGKIRPVAAEKVTPL